MITIVTDLQEYAFINNPVKLKVTSDRNVDFDYQITAVANNSGKVRLTVNIISGSGNNLTVGDTIYLDGFTASDNLYLNGLYATVSAISGSGPYTIDTTIDYITSATVTGSPRYYRKNANFEIHTTVKLKFGSGSYYSITGPVSRTVDGTNFEFDVSKYIKNLYSENVGNNETTDIVYPAVTTLVTYDLPTAQIDFEEYFDDPDGLQTTGDSASSSAEVVHDGWKYANDVLDKDTIFIQNTGSYEGQPLSRITRGLSKKYFSFDVVSKFDVDVLITYNYSDGSVVAIVPTYSIANKKATIVMDGTYMTDLLSHIRIVLVVSSTQVYDGYYYFGKNYCPGYLVKFKNDLGGWEILNCGLVNRQLEVDKSQWEKKLDFPYSTTDYGTKSLITRSDDILYLQTDTLINEDEILPLFESESVYIYDIENDRTMTGTVLTDGAMIRTKDSISAKFKVKLNRRK